MIKRILLITLGLTIVLAACAPAVTPEATMGMPEEANVEPPADEMMDKASDAEMSESTSDEMMNDSESEMGESGSEVMDEDMMGEGSEAMGDAMMDAPTWYSAELTNVRTGETFTINDFKGKVVLVETLAMWCSNCRQQQRQVKALHEALGMEEDLISIGLDIDPNENEADLKNYTDQNGFDWVYAVSPAEVSREISDLYGAQFLNPPSTPIVIIDRSGEAHAMPFGIKSAEELMEFIQPFLDEGM